MKQIIKLKTKGVRGEMVEVAKKFIGKECLIYTFNSSTIAGTITQVVDNAIMVENKGNDEAVNLDFVMRIREYPRNKNGKKKNIFD